jgi:hypothetical protein
MDTKTPYLAGRLRLDGADIRFTDSDGKTLIHFWIASFSTTTASNIWVKLPSITANVTKTIYMYYDYPSTATSPSSRNQVDDLFENWESGLDTNKWLLSGDALWHVVTSSKYEGGYAVQSGAISETQITSIQSSIVVDPQEQYQVTFAWASSIETVYGTDPFVFRVNDLEISPGNDRLWGERSWEYKTITPPAGDSRYTGNVTLTWQYNRNPDGFGGGLNACWLDYIEVRKYSPDPPTIDYSGTEEFYSQQLYLQARFYSDVLDAGAPNSLITKSTWTAITPTGTSLTTVNVYVRSSQTSFPANSADTSPAWQLLSQSPASYSYSGRYFQYRADLNADTGGTTTPIFVGILTNYEAAPPRPTGFHGIVYSSNTINWEWNDNSSNELGFRLFSSTKGFDNQSNAYMSSSTVTGMLAQLNPDETFYIETNLSPNTMYGRYIVAYSTVTGNIGTRLYDTALQPDYETTLAQAPQINSEKFKWNLNDPYGDPFNDYHYEQIPTDTFTTNATFYFTSNLISTGPSTADSYRVVWDTNSSHSWLNTETLWYAPTNFVHNTVTDDTIAAKPQFTKPLTFNTTSAYLHVRSYNSQNIPSGNVDVGPFLFNGCPSQITDLTAVASTTQEGAIKLTWSAPTAFSSFTAINAGQYIIKWAPTIITADSQFNSAPYGISIPTTTVPGSLETVVITGLTPGSFYGFAVKAVNDQNNYGALSTNILGSLLTRTSAAIVSKIVFKTAAPTTYVGVPSSALTIECEDTSGNPLRLFSNQVINLKLDGALLAVQNRGFSETQSPWFPTYSVQILQGSYSAQFYYKDDTAGSHTINASNSTLSWTGVTQTANVLPGKATTFVVDSNSTQDLGGHAQLTVRANDGYNSDNTSEDYIGSVVATVTVSGSLLTPPTYYFTAADNGSKVFDWQNNDTAGQATFSVAEDIKQSFTDVKFLTSQNALITASQGMIKHSVDGGSNWFAANSTGTGLQLNSITYDNSNSNILAAGNGGLVLVSTDSAQSFYTSDTGIGVDLKGIFFVDISTVYACGSGGKVIKSTDIGVHWSSNIGPGAETNNFNSIYFVTQSTGFVCGNGGKAYRTYN